MKKAFIPMCLLTLLLTFSSCASQEVPTPTASPSAPPMTTSTPATTSPGEMVDDMIPNMDMTDAPLTTDGTLGDEPLTPTASEQPAAQGVTTVSDARKAVDDIEDELERLSEVDEAQVVIAGNDAAVALEFDSQYQGGIDDRLREIVRERISSVISGVNNIAITDDAGLMDQLEALGDRLEGAADMADIQNELNAIINKITSAKA